jgi:hypothetical protein
MIFDYVVVRNVEDDNCKTTQEIVTEGRVVAKNRENALVQVGVKLALAGNEVTEETEVLLRPF